MKHKITIGSIIAGLLGAFITALAIGWIRRRNPEPLEEATEDSGSNEDVHTDPAPRRREPRVFQGGKVHYQQPHIAPRVYPHRGQR